MNTCQTDGLCRLAAVDDTLCSFCQTQLAFAQQRMLLLECLEKTAEVAEKAVTSEQLDERVEDEFESAFDKHLQSAIESEMLLSEDGLKEFEREFSRSIKDDWEEWASDEDFQSEREVDELIENALESKNFQSEQDVLEMIRMERREIDQAMDELQSRMTAFAAEQPIGFWQRVRWFFTGVAHKKTAA